MATRVPETDFTGDEAILFINTVCNFSRQVIFEIPRKDIGIDARIELLNENREPTGAFANIQSKRDLSYITESGIYKIRADKKHFETWSRYKYPVIGIVYNPDLKDARWVSISEHLQSHPNCIQSGPYVIDAPPGQPFSLEGFPKFQSYILAQHERLGTDSAQKLIDQYIRGDIIQKYESLSQLFSAYRWTALSCMFFYQAFRIEEEPTILLALADIISSYAPVAWRLSGTFPEHDVSLRNLAQKCIAGFGKAEVIKMLSTIDDEDGPDHIDNTWIISIPLRFIPNIETILCEIAKDSSLEPRIRKGAIIMLAGFLDYADASFYESLFQREKDTIVKNQLHWAMSQTGKSVGNQHI